MVSFTSEILCFYDFEAIFRKITMTHTSSEKKTAFACLFLFLIKKKKKRKISFIYGMKSENTLSGVTVDP